MPRTQTRCKNQTHFDLAPPFSGQTRVDLSQIDRVVRLLAIAGIGMMVTTDIPIERRTAGWIFAAAYLAGLNRHKPERVPWMGVDYWIAGLTSRGELPERYRGEGLFRLHRDLGVGFYLQGYFPYRSSYEGLQVSEERRGDLRLTRVSTPVGEVGCVEKYLPESACWAYLERYVKSWQDLRVVRYWYEHTHYEPDYQLAQERCELIGDLGQ